MSRRPLERMTTPSAPLKESKALQSVQLFPRPRAFLIFCRSLSTTSSFASVANDHIWDEHHVVLARPGFEIVWPRGGHILAVDGGHVLDVAVMCVPPWGFQQPSAEDALVVVKIHDTWQAVHVALF